jgi:predicted SnoaL-like aldol condensation-catalyzing enzyme
MALLALSSELMHDPPQSTHFVLWVACISHARGTRLYERAAAVSLVCGIGFSARSATCWRYRGAVVDQGVINGSLMAHSGPSRATTAILVRKYVMSDLDANRRNAIAFYEQMFNDCEPRLAIENFVGDEYIQHNPHVATGKEAFIAYFERMASEYPGKRVHIKRTVAEGDLVVLHCHQIWPEGLEYAGIDIFRFDENGKIVEHWDVLQVMPQSSANGNGMF